MSKTTGVSKPRPVDVHVGRRVRLGRNTLGMSQEQLGKAIGLTFQQVQKYERGANRIGASRLYELSRILDVPVSFFFDDMDEATKASGGARQGATLPASPAADLDPMIKPETLEFVRAYYGVNNVKVRKSFYDLVKSIAKAENGEA